MDGDLTIAVALACLSFQLHCCRSLVPLQTAMRFNPTPTGSWGYGSSPDAISFTIAYDGPCAIWLTGVGLWAGVGDISVKLSLHTVWPLDSHLAVVAFLAWLQPFLSFQGNSSTGTQIGATTEFSFKVGADGTE